MTYQVEPGSWSEMRAALLRQVVEAEGSIRKAAKAVGVPRSTLGAWLRDDRDEQARDVIADTLAGVARAAGLAVDQVCSRARDQRAVAARLACYRHLRELGLSYPTIGAIMDRDHTTVMAGCKRAPDEPLAVKYYEAAKATPAGGGDVEPRPRGPRKDCPTLPCTAVTCRHHLGAEHDSEGTRGYSGSHSCSLMAAAEGPRKLREIGGELGVSHELVRQVQGRAIGKVAAGLGVGEREAGEALVMLGAGS